MAGVSPTSPYVAAIGGHSVVTGMQTLYGGALQPYSCAVALMTATMDAGYAIHVRAALYSPSSVSPLPFPLPPPPRHLTPCCRGRKEGVRELLASQRSFHHGCRFLFGTARSRVAQVHGTVTTL